MSEGVASCHPELMEYVSDKNREQCGRSLACIARLVRATTPGIRVAVRLYLALATYLLI